MKEKVKSAPKELVRRGLDDGTDRLRGQLRDTAQRGQTDGYGGDQIEDTVVSGVRRIERGTERGIEALQKKIKKDRAAKKRQHTAANLPYRQEAPPNSPAKEESRVSASISQSNRPAIKTKDDYINRQDSSSKAPQPHALEQGRKKFQQEQLEKRVRDRQPAAKPSSDQSKQTLPASSPRQKPPSDRGAPSMPADRAKSGIKSRSGSNGRPAIKAARPPVKQAAGRSVKTAENASKKAIKTADRGAKAVQKTVQAVPQASRRMLQTLRASKKAAITARNAAKAGKAALRAALKAAQMLLSALAAGSSVVIAVVLVICLVGLLTASPFGIFFSGDTNDPNVVSPSVAIAQINREYTDTLSAYQAGGSYDRIEIQGRPPSWVDVFAVFSVKTVAGSGLDVAVLDADRVERLRTVFWDMTKITVADETVDHPAVGTTPAWSETVLTITITPRTVDDMRTLYLFTEQQSTMLDNLLTEGNRTIWKNLLYGTNGEIVAVALSQVGNVGGQPYWSWCGFSSRVEWCACFVSWCANECGYVDAGIIPKTAGCIYGANWFKERGLWQDKDYEPHPGDVIYYDWNCKGQSGPQDGVPDHVGIVERVENGIVYTVEGNSGDSCRQRSYSVGYYEIYGYGTLCP